MTKDDGDRHKGYQVRIGLADFAIAMAEKEPNEFASGNHQSIASVTVSA